MISPRTGAFSPLRWLALAVRVWLALGGVMVLASRGGAADYLIDVWTSDNDLPDNSVTAIAQTPDGYLWIGTYNGLVRFDGVRFVTFDPHNTPELRHARVLGLYADPQGGVWINTYDGSLTLLRDGVFRWEGRAGTVGHVFTNGGRTYFTTLSRGVTLRTETAGQPASWQTINLSRRNDATEFCQDASGVVWYLRRDGKIGRILGTNAVLLADELQPDSHVICLAADQGGDIWIGTATQIARWNGSAFADQTPTNGAASVPTTFLFFTTHDGYWAFTGGAVRHAVGRRWVADVTAWRELTKAQMIGLGAHEERDGDVWFRDHGQGLFHARGDGRVETLSATNGLPGNRVNCWFQDHEGNLWAGIERGGLVRLRKRSFDVIGATPAAQNFAVSTICEDGEGDIWIGTVGNGLNRWRAGQLSRFDLPDAVNKDAFYSAFPDAQGRLILSADREDLYLWATNQFQRATNNIHAIKCTYVDHEGRVWLGRQSELTWWSDAWATNYGTWSGLERRDVRAIAEDRHGTLWLGTGNGVLYQFAGGNFTAFHPPGDREEQAIWALLPDEDEEDTLWIGTFRGGLLRFRAGQFTRYTTDDGLPSDILCQILDDGKGQLWFGSHKGIFSVPKRAFEAFDRGEIGRLPGRSFGLEDGLPTLECSGSYQPSAWRARDGRLWFATVRGAVAVRPEEIQPNRVAPPVALEEFLVDGTNYPVRGTVRIPPGRHQFDFRFTALSFTAPDKVLFRYRLTGLDNDWVAAGGKRTAHYGPVAPGDYTFQVIACNNNGVWNTTGMSLAVRQAPFFWQTWWFELLAAAAALAAVSLAVRQAATRGLRQKLERLKQQRAIERERERIAKDIHDDLGAGLTQIMLQSSLAQREPPGQMLTDLTQISETARDLVRAMDEIVWAINPENDTLDGLTTYIGKFVQDYCSLARLRCRLDLPAQLPAIPLSAETRHHLFLAIKETLNNVVKHSQATELSFQLRLEPERFTFVIRDNGIGFTPGSPAANVRQPDRISSGHGLRNLTRRLEEIGGGCTITAAPGQGTQIELAMPAGHFPILAAH